MPLKFQWFDMWSPVGHVLEIPLDHGDMYVMSEKAVGSDWLDSGRGLTLRHASGSKKYAENKVAKSKIPKH